MSADAQTHPDILSVDRQPLSVTLTLSVPASLCYFPGHFPAYPILPGVVQIAWAVDFAATYLEVAGAVRDLERLKFTHPILPAARLALTLRADADHKLVQFHYHTPSKSFSIGRLIYV